MGDAENTLPPTKKRSAGREISRDNPGLDDDEETSVQEIGTFKKASDEVLAGRRFVKVRRPPSSSTPSANPFAGINLIPSAVLKSSTPEASANSESEKKVLEAVNGNNNANEETDESNVDAKPKETKADVEVETVNEAKISEVDGEKLKELEKAEAVDNKAIEGESAENKEERETADESIEKTEESASFSSFRQLSSSQNAFTGIIGTGFSSSTFSFGVSKDGSSASCASGFSFGQKTDSVFNVANNNGSSLFATQRGSTGTKSEKVGFSSLKEVSVETGEENEKAVFTADSVLFEFLEGGWRERGKGELKVNVPTTGTGTGKARLVMRSKGNYRLILNACLYPDMKLANMDKKGVTFACMNSGGEGKEGLSTFALKFKDVSLVDEFCSIVTENKDKTSAVFKSLENSPKASDE